MLVTVVMRYNNNNNYRSVNVAVAQSNRYRKQQQQPYVSLNLLKILIICWITILMVFYFMVTLDDINTYHPFYHINLTIRACMGHIVETSSYIIALAVARLSIFNKLRSGSSSIARHYHYRVNGRNSSSSSSSNSNAMTSPSLVLPEFMLYQDDEKDRSFFIYLDFPADDRLFSIENYKALESLLTIYPNAIYRCQIYSSRDIYDQKVGNSLSAMQFIKYKKLHYNISTIALNTKLKPKATLTGTHYREKYLKSCCLSCKGDDDDDGSDDDGCCR